MQWQHKLTTAKVNQTKDFQWIDNHMDQVERIYFAGGEPMIMPSHWYILEKLHARKRFDVELSYNTNMLKLSHGGKRALDYWQDWPHKQVKVQPSIDETGERAEWIRYGTVWDTVKQNIISVRDAGIWMEPMLSVGAYNILRLPQLLKELYELFNNKIQINIVWNKEWRLSNLNWEDRQSVKPQLEQLHDLVSDPGVMNQLYHLLDSEEITSSKLLDRCALLDLHRGKNSMQIIPGFQAVNKRLGNRYEYARERYLNKQPVEKMKI
jgi:sulfatase maturation enzyme AslB (radical SAM superfamily)